VRSGVKEESNQMVPRASRQKSSTGIPRSRENGILVSVKGAVMDKRRRGIEAREETSNFCFHEDPKVSQCCLWSQSR
jgi:hypothetical protein